MKTNPQFKTHLATEDAQLVFGGHLAKVIQDGTVIFLHGPLGAGKTTLTRGFLRGLGYEGKVKSPTYTLVEPYEVADKKIFHFDLYRLNHAEELEHIGINEYFSAESICLIEWPEKGFPLLPPSDIDCYISINQQGRDVRLQAHSAKGAQVLHDLHAPS